MIIKEGFGCSPPVLNPSVATFNCTWRVKTMICAVSVLVTGIYKQFLRQIFDFLIEMKCIKINKQFLALLGMSFVILFFYFTDRGYMYNRLHFPFEMIYQFVFTLKVYPSMHLLIAFASQKYFYWGWTVYLCAWRCSNAYVCSFNFTFAPSS